MVKDVIHGRLKAVNSALDAATPVDKLVCVPGEWVIDNRAFMSMLSLDTRPLALAHPARAPR